MNSDERYLRPIVAFDVDDTLIDRSGNPRERVIQLFNLLQHFGCRMVIWSNGHTPGYNDHGVVYAMKVRDKLNLKAECVDKGSIQPDITIDDLGIFDRISEGTLGKVNVKV